MKLCKKLGIIAVASFLCLLFYAPVFALSTAAFAKSELALADTSCQPIYGGGETCIQSTMITIKKVVVNPQTKNQKTDFNPGDPISFQITITNTGNTTIADVSVRDFFPQYINFIGQENFDPNTRTFSKDIINLSPNESQTIQVDAQVVSVDQLPVDQGIVCAVNQAIAIQNGQSAVEANAQFCIHKSPQLTKGGLPVQPPVQVATTPPTGPEDLPLLALLPTSILGVWLRKISFLKNLKIEGGEK